MPNYLSEVTGYSMYVILTELSSYLSLFFVCVCKSPFSVFYLIWMSGIMTSSEFVGTIE